jgi:hypothetical protein
VPEQQNPEHEPNEPEHRQSRLDRLRAKGHEYTGQLQPYVEQAFEKAKNFFERSRRFVCRKGVALWQRWARLHPSERANWVIALATIGILVTALLQYGVFLKQKRVLMRQLAPMFGQQYVMQSQLNEMRSGSAQTDKQIQISIEAQRAWVGLLGSRLEPLSVGQPIIADVPYINSGNTPATEFSVSVTPLIYTKEKWDSAEAFMEQFNYQQSCMSLRTGNIGSVAYPRATYNMRTTVPEKEEQRRSWPMVSQDVLDGNSIIEVIGCMVYHSFGTDHHSAFCRYYRSKEVDIGNLVHCAIADAAD